MKLQNSIKLHSLVLFFIFFSAIQLKASSEQQDKWVYFHKNIQNATRFNVSLKYSPSTRNTFGEFSQEIKSEPLPENKKKDSFTQQINIPTAVDGYQYRLLLRQVDDLLLMNHNSERIFKTQIQRWKQNNKPETFREGYIMSGRDIEIPFEILGSQINLTANEPVSGMFRINIYGSDQTLVNGNFRSNINGQLSGSILTETATLNISVTCRNSSKLEDRVINLSIKPFDENIRAASANGKITDIICLNEAKIVVEAIASDSSEIILAVIQGDIHKRPEQATTLILNKLVPNFSRTEFTQRKQLSLDEIKTQAGPQGYIVMIFGESKENLIPGMSDRRRDNQPMREIALDEIIASKIIRQDVSKTVVIAFVCKTLPLENLYEKWLGQNLDFLILSDFANPMNAISPFSSREYSPNTDRGMSRETLSEFFGIAENKIAIMLISGSGDLVYINKDAGPKFAEILTEINTLIKK